MQNHAFYTKYKKKSLYSYSCAPRASAHVLQVQEYARLTCAGFVSCRLRVWHYALVGMCLALVACALLCCPSRAYAKSYSMPNVTIEASLQDNGDLYVTEQRQFDFMGSFSAVWWSFDELPSDSSLSIRGVRLAHVDDQGDITDGWTTLSSTSFQLVLREEGGPGSVVYSFDEPENTVYVFLDETDSQIVVELTYVIQDAAQAYSDVGELYWQFVGDQWEQGASNITMTLTLPAPAQATVEPGETVRAWGHGPLDSTVEINTDGTVVCSVPSLSVDSYAEVRILFPTEWLSGVSESDSNAYYSISRLDAALEEEKTWADEANVQRATAFGLLLVVTLSAIVLLVWAIRSFIRYGKELKPTFTDEYWRDIPIEDEHPAVVGRVCRFNKESTIDFTATILHLANIGALRITRNSYTKQGLIRTKTHEDYLLERVPDVELTLNSEIDRRTMALLFDTISEDGSTLWLEDISTYADKHPKEFSQAMLCWQGLVSSCTNVGEYFESYSTAKRVIMTTVAAVCVVVYIVLAFLFSNPLVLIPGIITGVVLVIVSRFMDRRTQKGADAFARCEALKKWLTEFSALDERPPSDVAVWGEFMVYALIFGVAKEATEQLGRAVPEAFDEDYYTAQGIYMSSWWIWLSPSLTTRTLPDIGSAFEGALSDSLEATSSTLSGTVSSGAGFGGGFSVGGGGGFGGGGGGAR